MRWWLGLLVLVLVGWWRVQWWQQTEQQLRDGNITSVTMVVTEPMRFGGNSCQLEWRGWKLYGFQRICDTSRRMHLTAGSVIHLEFKHTANDRGKRQLQIRHIETGQTRHLGDGLLSRWFYWAARWRATLLLQLRQLLPEDEAMLMAGILWGARDQLSEQFYQALIHTGTMHVVAASGYNISVVMGALLWILLQWVSRKKAAGITLGLIWVYVLVSGLQPPIVRAGITASLVLISWIIGKDVWVLFGYVLSGGVMLCVAPWLLTSISFQLSMAATGGVIWGSAAIGQMTRAVHSRLSPYPLMVGAWENLTTTLAATIAVAPLSLIYFGQISWWAFVVNPVVLGMIPLLMYLGIAIIFLGSIWSLLGQVVAWLALPLTKLWIGIVMVGGNLPGGILRATMNWWWAAGWWLMWIGVVVYVLRTRTDA